MPSRVKKWRGALIGYGFIASRGHLPAYQQLSDRFEIVAIADPCEARLAAARQALPEGRFYTDAFELMERESLDFVDICTPPVLHFEAAQAALGRGFHVICEKPLTCRLDEADRLRELARAQGRVLFPAHCYLYAPVIEAVTRHLQDGVIGPPHSLCFQVYRISHAKGLPEWNPDWRRILAYSGGGIGMDHGSHAFYLAERWLGSKPNTVKARTETASQTFIDTEDLLEARVEFPRGLLDIHLSWQSNQRRVIYKIQGEHGSIQIDDDKVEIRQTGKQPKLFEFPSNWEDAGHSGWFSKLFERFDQQLHLGKTDSVELDEALSCVEIIQACYRSAQSHRMVTFPERGIR